MYSIINEDQILIRFHIYSYAKQGTGVAGSLILSFPEMQSNNGATATTGFK
jgi:hypothetical protein